MIEAMKQALEALENVTEDYVKNRQYKHNQAITAIKEAIAELESQYPHGMYGAEDLDKAWKSGYDNCKDQFAYLDEQEPVAWKLMPRDATDSMLKAMDECSTEGYDERLYAGHAASVYMAAVDVAPIPPKQESKDEPKCVAIVEVFGKDWRLDYMALPVGKHKLYAQQYTYTTPPQRTWVGLMRGVRVEGNAVVITVKGGNDEARALCGELINEMEKNT